MEDVHRCLPFSSNHTLPPFLLVPNHCWPLQRPLSAAFQPIQKFPSLHCKASFMHPAAAASPHRRLLIGQAASLRVKSVRRKNYGGMSLRCDDGFSPEAHAISCTGDFCWSSSAAVNSSWLPECTFMCPCAAGQQGGALLVAAQTDASLRRSSGFSLSPDSRPGCSVELLQFVFHAVKKVNDGDS